MQSERVTPLGANDADRKVIDEFEYAPGSLDRRSHRWVLGMQSTAAVVLFILLALQGGWMVGLTIATGWGALVVALVRVERRQRIRTDGDYLIVVNSFRTHRLARRDIRAFRITPPNPSQMQWLEIAMVDHWELDCGATRLPKFSRGLRRRPDLLACKAALDEWLRRPTADSSTLASGN